MIEYSDASLPLTRRLGPGVYALLFRLTCDLTIPTRQLGVKTYSAGWYAYVGSARRGISSRLKHHMRAIHPRPHWHIDYLLPQGSLSTIVVAETSGDLECTISRYLAGKFRVISRFGASDCRCKGHLFQSDSKETLLIALQEAIKESECIPQIITIADHSECSNALL